MREAVVGKTVVRGSWFVVRRDRCHGGRLDAIGFTGHEARTTNHVARSCRIGLAAALLAGAAAAQPVSVTARATSTELTVGQRFTVTMEASGPAGTTWEFPAEAGDGNVVLRAAGQPAGSGAFVYEAAAFALGEISVPATAVRYRLPDGSEGEARSGPIPLTIGTLLPKEESERALADIRGPVKLPLGAWFWGGLAAAIALAAAAVALLRRRRRPTVKAAPPVPELPPDVEANAAFDALAASPLLAADDLKPFYVALAEIAKRYLERRLDAPVLEMTTAEAMALLRENAAARELAPSLRDLMLAADHVKFARGHSERPTAERHLAAARAMVTVVEARLRPTLPPAAPEKAA
jgi:hypothetical protein